MITAKQPSPRRRLTAPATAPCTPMRSHTSTSIQCVAQAQFVMYMPFTQILRRIRTSIIILSTRTLPKTRTVRSMSRVLVGYLHRPWAALRPSRYACQNRLTHYCLNLRRAQAFKKFTSGGGGGGGGGGGSQTQLISMAMAEASKLFDQHGGGGGGKQDAVNGAAMTVTKLLVQSKFSGGTTGGGDSGGLGQLAGLVRVELYLHCQC
jgi:hypothetical protein